MSDEILAKSRTSADRESFTRDDNGKVARRVTDNVTHTMLQGIQDTMSSLAFTLNQIYILIANQTLLYLVDDGGNQLVDDGGDNLMG